MTLLHKAIDQLSEQDIRSLIDQKVREGRTIDYKQTLPGSSDSEKREFRFDVSSFANAAGGYLLYGIKEKQKDGKNTGEPEEITPLHVNPDSEILRLEGTLQAQIEPRLPGVRIRFIELKAGGHVGIIRVPRSWMGLHLAIVNHSYRFYSRNSGGKYILDVSEIRSGFVAAETGYERLRRFRLERLARMIANEGPVSMLDGPKLILHLIPFSSLDPTIEWDLDAVRTSHAFAPMRSSDFSHQYNFDGLMKYAIRSSGDSESYVQFFRSGAIEATEICGQVYEGTKIIPSLMVEKDSIDALTAYLAVMRAIGIAEPFIIGLSLIGIKDYFLQLNTFNWGHHSSKPFRENELIVPEVLINSFEQETHAILRPALDRIWNAAGHSGSPYYDAGGKWIGK